MTSTPDIVGQYSDGKTSRRIATDLYLTAEGRIGLHGVNKQPVAFATVSISSRIGNTPRYVEFPNGAHFETADNDGIDRIISQASAGRAHNLAHKLESSKRWVFVALVVVIFFGWSFIQFGIPYFSKQIAFMLNDEQTHMLGEGALDSLDEHLMETSKLSNTRQADLRREFSALLKTLDVNNMRIVFRHSGIIGANALALPDGTIVFTDALINLAADNQELVSVMLHEIGHLQYRHSLRRVIQSFSLAMFIAAITGDVSTSSTIITGLPVVLVESGYSRDMETEADSFALQYMLQHDIDPTYFSSMMQKLQLSHSKGFMQCAGQESTNIQTCLSEAIDAVKNNQDDQQKEHDFGQYFASHPLTQERVARFRDAKKPNSN
jgi:Zn-dependent protease with chaperone function